MCEICQEEYAANRSNQKYCPGCGENPDAARKRFGIAEQMLRQHAGIGSEPQERTCAFCGKKFLTAFGRGCCSTECALERRRAISVCIHCGANLWEHGVDRRTGYCSEKCREEEKLDRAKRDGQFRECENCGKSYIARTDSTRFCSRKCFQLWSSAHKGWKRCSECGKRIPAETKEANDGCCSKECAHERRMREHYILSCFRTAREPKQRVPKPPVHLCAECRTPQRDCERFTSGFRYFPDGAKQKLSGKNLIVTECPKYIGG